MSVITFTVLEWGYGTELLVVFLFQLDEAGHKQIVFDVFIALEWGFICHSTYISKCLFAHIFDIFILYLCTLVIFWVTLCVHLF